MSMRVWHTLLLLNLTALEFSIYQSNKIAIQQLAYDVDKRQSTQTVTQNFRRLFIA